MGLYKTLFFGSFPLPATVLKGALIRGSYNSYPIAVTVTVRGNDPNYSSILGLRRGILGLCRAYWGYIRIMEQKMETTINRDVINMV